MPLPRATRFTIKYQCAIQFWLGFPVCICARFLPRSLSREFQERQTFDDATVHEMFFDNLSNVCSANLCVPNAVRIDHHRSPNRAEAHRSAFGQHYAALRILALRFPAKQNSARFQFALECVPDLGAVSCGAGFTGADKDVMPNRRGGDWRQSPQFALIIHACLSWHNGRKDPRNFILTRCNW